jgi:tetratricopeptide (TPR) repeat protein
LTHSGTAGATEPKNSELSKGLNLLKNMEDADAIEAFKRALNWPGNTPKIRGQIYLHLGIAWSNQLKREAAVESFRRALVEDPKITLPGDTSPKIRQLFHRARVEIERERAPASPQQTTTAASPPVEQPVQPQPRPSLFRRYLWAWVGLGATVIAAGAGVTLGVLARDSEDRASDTSLTYDDAKAHHDRAQSRALGANIMFGVAGAAAVATGVLFYLGSRSGERPRTTAVLGPTPGGMMGQVRTAW